MDAPEQLGPYRLLRTLGAGASATVYLAQRTDFAQRVAIKRFHPHIQSTTQERDFLTLLDHPNIVRLLDQAADAHASRYLVMEYIDGLPLYEYADTHGFSTSQRVQLLLPILDAIAYAHQRLLVHGDLKPTNILVEEQGSPRLLDFGAATQAGTAAAAALTLRYASPAQRLGERLTVSDDLYALGLIARELLAGIPPEVSTSTPLKAFVSAAAATRSTTPSGLQSQLAGNLQAIIFKALASDPQSSNQASRTTLALPEARYQSVQLLRQDLANHLAHLPVSARRAGAFERARLWTARHQLLAAMSALLLLVGLGSVLGVAWKAAQAAHQRRVAETRLQDLIRLNSTLEGELYRSLDGLPRSGKARAELLRESTQTLDALAVTTGPGDRAFRRELALEYEKLARLELTPATDSPVDRAAALQTINKGIFLLAVESNDPVEQRLRHLRDQSQ